MLTEGINKVVPFLLLPILTIYLSPSDYGIVATYGAFCGIITVFIHLSMNGAITVNFFKLEKNDLRIYIANVLMIVFVSAIIIFFTVFVFRNQLSAKLEIPSTWLLLGVAAVIMQFATNLNLGLWQAEQRAKPFGIYKFFQMLLNASAVLVLVVGFGLKWEGQLIGQLVVSTLFAFLSIVFIYHRGYLLFQAQKDYIVDALKFGLPLIPHALSGWFRIGVDRMFLTTLIGTSATGLYSVGYQFGMIIGIFAMTFNQAFSPFLYKKLANITEKEKLKLVKYTYAYFVGILLLASLLSLFAPWFIERFLNERYLPSNVLIPWVAFGYAFQGMYFMVVNYIFYVKKTYALSAITFLTGLVHVLISYVFIKTNGAIGAAQATTISFFIMFVLVWILSAKLYNMPWTLKINRRI